MACFISSSMPLCPYAGLVQCQADENEHTRIIRYIICKMPKLFFALQSISTDLQCLLVCRNFQEEQPSERSRSGTTLRETATINVSQPGQQFSFSRRSEERIGDNLNEARYDFDQNVANNTYGSSEGGQQITPRAASRGAQDMGDQDEANESDFVSFVTQALYAQGLQRFVEMMQNMNDDEIRNLLADFFIPRQQERIMETMSAAPQVGDSRPRVAVDRANRTM